MPVNPKEAPPGHMAVQYDPQNGANCSACAFVLKDKCRKTPCTPILRKDSATVIFVSIGHPPDGDE